MVPMQRHRERALERLVNPVDTVRGSCKGRCGHGELTCLSESSSGPKISASC